MTSSTGVAEPLASDIAWRTSRLEDIECESRRRQCRAMQGTGSSCDHDGTGSSALGPIYQASSIKPKGVLSIDCTTYVCPCLVMVPLSPLYQIGARDLEPVLAL